MPRSASMCQASSLLRRTRPKSLAPADLTRALTIGFAAAEFQVHDACQTDPRLRRHRRLHVPVALLALGELDARRDLLAVDGRSQPAQVLEEPLPRRRIAPQPQMLARNVGQR